MKPDASQHNPDPEYFRDLVNSTGMTREAVATEVLGCTDRALRYYMSGDRKIPYPVQFTLEAWVLSV